MLSSMDLDVLEPPPSPRSLQTSTGQISCIKVSLQSLMITCLITHENDGCACHAQTVKTYSVVAVLHIQVQHEGQDV